MAAEKNLPVTHMFAKSAQLDRANQFSRFKRRANVVGRLFREISNQQRAPANKPVLAFLFGKSFVRRLARLGRRFLELIVARPKRKLIDQVLRLDDVTWRMSRPFDAFVLEVKRNFRSAMSFVGNQK